MSDSNSKLAEITQSAYLSGFMASGEGWNGEYPDDAEIYSRNEHWLKRRDEELSKILGPAREFSAYVLGLEKALQAISARDDHGGYRAKVYPKPPPDLQAYNDCGDIARAALKEQK